MRKDLFFQISAIALALAFNINLASASQSASEGHSLPLIVSPINENSRVTLEGNTRPEANAKNDRGLVADDLTLQHMQLQLRRPAEQEAALEQYIEDLQTPGSTNYHQWLNAQQFGQYGLAKQDLETIKTWLQSHGFTVMAYANGVVIDFSGTAGMVRQAFQTEIHNLDVKGKSHISNMSDPRIPAALAPAIVGITSLNDFRPHAMHQPRVQYTFTSGGQEFQAVVPGDLATIYNLNPLFTAGTTGTGQTVVVVEDTNFKAADWTTFRNKFGLSVTKYPGAKLTQVHPASKSPNNCSNPGINGDDIEASLDAEWASAAAPNAAIELISCADTATTFGGIIAIQNLINASKTPPAIISMSYGECEALTGAAANATFKSAFQQAVSEGVSVFVSAGDEDAAACDRDAEIATHGIAVTGWGETPYNVAVGGTDFGDTYAGTNSTYWKATNTSTFESAKSYVPEIPWNDSCAGVLLATFETGSGITYGSSGFCNTTTGEQFLNDAGGSGGPSKCATGSPSSSGVVSGTCKGYAKPSWQVGFLGVPKDGVRDIPDVSLFAANGLWGHYYVFCDSDVANGGAACTGAPDNWSGAGGTSFSSPILAGIQALVNQKNGSRQGNPNVAFYKLAAAEYGKTGSTSCNSTFGNGVASTCVFYDVTQGDMDANCKGTHNCYIPSGENGVISTSNTAYKPAYGTTTGWDFATGLGTVNATNLVNAWSSVAP
ncbi:MAG: protease pro-enzyme activation domain-containing protein [Candidatus Sulfotelmatobacter sp.]|jgi:subtilase family serine protease